MPKRLAYLVLAVAAVISVSVRAQERISTLVQWNEEAHEVTILAKQNLAFHSRPDFYSNVLGVFESGEELNAFGRDAEGDWLQCAEGWVNSRNVAAAGDIMTLRQTEGALTLQAFAKLGLRSGPDGSYITTEEILIGQFSVAIGRNHDGTWLETPKGWIPASEVEFDGDILLLPVSFASITVTAAKNAAFLSGPTWEADVLEIFPHGDEVFAYERTADSNWVKTPMGWLNIASGMDISGDLMSLPQAYFVSLMALTEQNVYSNPSINSSIVGILDERDEKLVLMRTEDGLWLQTVRGWITAESVEVSGDMMRLPSSPAGIKGAITGLPVVYLRSGPRYAGSERLEQLRRGDQVFAIGRNESGSWLQLNDGWINANYIHLGGDILTLPVTDDTHVSTSANQSTRRATPVPSPETKLDASEIRTLVSRHADDIRILDIEISNSSTTIDYDLKPWPFIPNEQIANEVAFKIICAIRVGQDIPNTLKLIGLSHFTSDIGRKFTAPSVSMDISASNANRIVCRGNDASDINWRRIASRYKSHPIPSGASIDYD